MLAFNLEEAACGKWDVVFGNFQFAFVCRGCRGGVDVDSFLFGPGRRGDQRVEREDRDESESEDLDLVDHLSSSRWVLRATYGIQRCGICVKNAGVRE